MPETTGLDWFLGAAYHVDLRCSLLGDLLAAERASLAELPFEGDAVRDYLRGRVEASEATMLESQSAAYAVLLNQDLKRVLEAAEDPEISSSIDSRSNMTEILENTLRFAARQLRDLGFEHEFATRLHLVDGFPKPYDTMQATVLAVDEGDKLQFGIEPGVYFRSSPRPFYSEHIACHEIVHVALGHVSPMEFSSRLEEGIAEFLGAGYISLRHLGPKLTENIFVLNRLSRLLDPNWERYLEATRQIFVVAARTGLPGLVQIMNNGRSAINELEQETLVGEWSLEASSGFRHYDGDLLDLMSRVLLTYPRTLVASPAAVLLAPYLEPGTTMQEAATASGMDIDLATQAAQELQDDLGLLALRPDKIIVTFSQAHRVGGTSAMRYSSPD